MQSLHYHLLTNDLRVDIDYILRTYSPLTDAMYRLLLNSCTHCFFREMRDSTIKLNSTYVFALYCLHWIISSDSCAIDYEVFRLKVEPTLHIVNVSLPSITNWLRIGCCDDSSSSSGTSTIFYQMIYNLLWHVTSDSVT